ncbi:MAG: penicillin-binding protein 2, partial [Tissierellaceae bacterium]
MVERYFDDNLLSHTIGYVNKAENRGQTGIEKVYDEFLRNADKNSFFVEYDKNKSIVLGSSYYVDNAVEAYQPAGVMLTIDYRIQKITEMVLDFFSAKGAVIVTDIESGEILALASRPNFNQKNITAYLDKDDMALYNKAVQVSYPPGSIFKIVVLLAALEEDMGFLENSYFCKGYEVINNTTIKCSGNHGQISLRDGFAKSCNSVFIQIGKELGAKKIIDMAKRLGLGEKVNIGLAEEIEGILPEGEELLGPAIGNISIGQGKIEATPLQISNILLTIANDGVQKDMTLVKGITSKEGQILKAYNREEDKRVISKDLSQVAKELLEEVLSSGTARSLDLEDIGGAAGKTGSAEASLKGQFTIHGWFAGYYPKDEPRYGITILVEEASSGSKSAAPIFEKICKEINKNI